MEITEDQYKELFERDETDVKICLHETRIQPLPIEIDGDHKVGYIARMLGHDATGKLVTIDFVTTEDTLQETMSRFVEAGMTAAFMSAMNEVNRTGMPGPLLALLQFVDQINTDEGENDSDDHERTGDETERAGIAGRDRDGD